MPVLLPGGLIRKPVTSEPLILSTALNQGTNTETASTRAATAISMSEGDQRDGLNHVAARKRSRARLSRCGHMVNSHLAPFAGRSGSLLGDTRTYLTGSRSTAIVLG